LVIADGGRYPYQYLEMIEKIFGEEPNTIEVCSSTHISKRDFTIDINPKTKPDLIDDGEILSSISNNIFNRWRCDPPYNVKTAKETYGTHLLSPIKLLKAGARGCAKLNHLCFYFWVHRIINGALKV
jgi:hypothetical protein